MKVGGRDAGTEMRKGIRAAVGERSSADAWGGRGQAGGRAGRGRVCGKIRRERGDCCRLQRLPASVAMEEP